MSVRLPGPMVLLVLLAVGWAAVGQSPVHARDRIRAPENTNHETTAAGWSALIDERTDARDFDADDDEDDSAASGGLGAAADESTPLELELEPELEPEPEPELALELEPGPAWKTHTGSMWGCPWWCRAFPFPPHSHPLPCCTRYGEPPSSRCPACVRCAARPTAPICRRLGDGGGFGSGFGSGAAGLARRPNAATADERATEGGSYWDIFCGPCWCRWSGTLWGCGRCRKDGGSWCPPWCVTKRWAPLCNDCRFGPREPPATEGARGAGAWDSPTDADEDDDMGLLWSLDGTLGKSNQLELELELELGLELAMELGPAWECAMWGPWHSRPPPCRTRCGEPPSSPCPACVRCASQPICRRLGSGSSSGSGIVDASSAERVPLILPLAANLHAGFAPAAPRLNAATADEHATEGASFWDLFCGPCWCRWSGKFWGCGRCRKDGGWLCPAWCVDNPWPLLCQHCRFGPREPDATEGARGAAAWDVRALSPTGADDHRDDTGLLWSLGRALDESNQLELEPQLICRRFGDSGGCGSGFGPDGVCMGLALAAQLEDEAASDDRVTEGFSFPERWCGPPWCRWSGKFWGCGRCRKDGGSWCPPKCAHERWWWPTVGPIAPHCGDCRFGPLEPPPRDP